jgi:hypothetical protein
MHPCDDSSGLGGVLISDSKFQISDEGRKELEFY